MKTYNVQESIAAQRKFCEQEGYPHFAPRSGVCYRCRRNIYELSNHRGFETGIDVESAAKELVTGCPHCNRSYCD
jgi:hypothetical protein